MSTNAVNLGIGNASGMFFHAQKGTQLPASPSATPDATKWKEVGYISENGITWHHGRASELLKDWSKSIRRQLQTDPTGTVTAPIISTTEESLKVIFGEDNVNVTDPTAQKGKIVTLEMGEGVVSDEEAFLFLMKDGDDLMMLGTTAGRVTNLDDISFAPGSPITWNGTVSADKWTFAKEEPKAST